MKTTTAPDRQYFYHSDHLGSSSFITNGRQFLGHQSGDRNHESRAWNFAANNAPNPPQTVKFKVGGKDVLVTNPLIQQIRSLNSNPQNPNKQIQNWLYKGFIINVIAPLLANRAH